jgi:hypothetical protein
MNKNSHMEAQIIAALKWFDAGRTTEDVAREQGANKHTIFACRLSRAELAAYLDHRVRVRPVFLRFIFPNDVRLSLALSYL